MGTTRTLLVVAALAFVPPTTTGAQLRLGKDASYFCVVEFAGGVTFNETTKKWEGTGFRPDGRFVLRLKFLRNRVQKGLSGKDETVHDYTVTITASGKTDALLCSSRSADPKIVTVDADADFFCDSFDLHEYRFNLATNRFIRAYLQGYISGRDNKGDTPSVEGGTCTKID